MKIWYNIRWLIMQLKGELEKGGAKMAIENDIADDRPKVYLETSFMFYLTGLSVHHHPAQLSGGL